MSGGNFVRDGGNARQVQINNSLLSLPGSIAASGTYSSPIINAFGMSHLTVAAQMDHAGTLSVQRYIDNQGSLVAGAAVTAAMSSGTLAVVDNIGTIGFQSFKFSIINSSGGIGTPSNVLALLSVV